jgi:acetyl-CoA carboxylase biotin carboxyl carrier protein
VAEPGDNPRPFDVRTVRYLVRLMAMNDLSEIDLAEGEQRIKIRRGPRVVTGAALPVAAAPLPAPTPATTPTAATPAKAEAAPAKKLIEIKSPTARHLLRLA